MQLGIYVVLSLSFHKQPHVLLYEVKAQNVQDVWPFPGVFDQQEGNQVLEVLGVNVWYRVLFVLNNFEY